MKRLPVSGRDARREIGLESPDGRGACRMSLAAERSDDGMDGAPIVGRCGALDQPVALEAIGELRDIGAHALERAGEGAEPGRPSRRDEDVERLVLGDRQPDLGKRGLEPTLDAARGVEEDEHRLGQRGLDGWLGGLRKRGDAGRCYTIHVMNYTVLNSVRQAIP